MGLLANEIFELFVSFVPVLFFYGELLRMLSLFYPFYKVLDILLMPRPKLIELFIIEIQLIQIKWPPYINLNNIQSLMCAKVAVDSLFILSKFLL